MSYILVLLGIILLYLGGEFLVRNSSRLARSLGISPLVIGLTVVAFGTSSPELAATLVSAWQGIPAVAMGNVIGSNIANIGLILGFTALIYPLSTRKSFFRRELPIMIGVELLLFLGLWSGAIERYEGVILLLLLGGFLIFLVKNDSEVLDEFAEADDVAIPLWRTLAGVVLGVFFLVLGARALVEGAVDIARSFGVAERVIGLSLVALGTSLPELASSMVAAFKRETDIILGNIVGSNIFNVLAILGTTSIFYPLEVSYASVSSDLWVMLGLSLLVAPLMLRGYRMGRRGGSFLLLAYVAYIAYLFA